MSGSHGWVVPRPDGAKARCGGPAICTQCARELAQKNAADCPRCGGPRTMDDEEGPDVTTASLKKEKGSVFSTLNPPVRESP